MNQTVEARHQICNLLYRYAEAVDDGNFAVLRELFSRAVLHAAGVEYRGADGVEEMFVRYTIFYDRQGKRADVPAESGKPGTSHIMTNPIIELAEDGCNAAARSRYSVFQCRENFPLQVIIQGRYDDRFACDENGNWYFTERSYRMDSMGDLSQHLVQMPPDF